MSDIKSLNELIGGTTPGSVVNEDKKLQNSVTNCPVPEGAPNAPVAEQQPQMVDRSGEGAKDLHSQTPHDSLSNLSALVADMDTKVEEAKAVYDEKVQEEELEEIAQEKEKAMEANDEIIEVEDDDIPEVKDTKSATEQANLLVQDDSLSKIKVLKFKKNDQASSTYKALLEKRSKEHDARSSQAVLCNSGYSVNISGLRSPEILALEVNQQTTDTFTFTKFLYGKLYDHMVRTNVGKMSWETWLKNTSLLELNILAYAEFCSTYPDVNEYPAVCSDPDCQKEHGQFYHKYSNEALMYLDEKSRKETSEKILEILKSDNPTELFKNANVNFNIRKELSTGTILDIRHPSLYNHLIDTLSEMKDRQLLNTNEMLYNLMPYIEAAYVYIPERNGYLKLEDFEDKFTELKYMSDDDLADVLKIMDEIKQSYAVKFGIRNVVCPKCGRKAIDEPIDDMMSLLFFIHEQKTQQK